jgi:hypothetical protein
VLPSAASAWHVGHFMPFIQSAGGEPASPNRQTRLAQDAH